MKSVFHPHFACTWKGLLSVARLRWTCRSPAISADFRRSSRRQSSASCRNVSPTFIAILEVVSPKFVFPALIVRFESKCRTEAREYRQRSSRILSWAGVELASEVCEKDYVNSEADWKSILRATAREQQ